MESELVGLLGFLALILLLVLRVPVGIAMIAVAMAGYALIVSPDAALARLGGDVFSGAASYTLSVIPLFILMGLLLARAELGKDLYDLFNTALWRVRGGLGLATVAASSGFGSVSGSAVASASTMSVVAIPEMRRYGYDDGLAAACTAVGGTLGTLIPPSAVLVLYGILTEESIGQILIGGIVPGIMTTLLLMVTALVIVWWRPELAPAVPERLGPGVVRMLLRVWAVPVIFGLSMGGIYFGVFTPTEAGAAGASMAFVYSIATRRLGWSGVWDAASQAIRISAMIFLIIIAGQIFGFFLSATGIPQAMGSFVGDLAVAPWVVATMVFAVYFLLGALMDEIAILVIMTPITYPVMLQLGYDPIWFGVLTVMMLLSGLLTPPVGLVTFVVGGISDIPLGKIFKAVAPFWLALIAAVLLVIAFPDIVLFLPGLMY
ncbi:TRAP transporter large permease [Egibacter rhizosphaerae]|uniref:TRAP transporter large permease n=1 Tax=Egibacter rhizosphaerae TaxID=1670831 RepID=UPI0013F15B8E|nr:TRAP transporter large permease [Egibacter rhizosphaerae]